MPRTRHAGGAPCADTASAQPWEAKAREDRARYAKEMSAYKAQGGDAPAAAAKPAKGAKVRCRARAAR